MLISTLIYSVSYVLQHKGTVESMAANGGEAVGFKKLMKHRVWLLGAILFYTAGAIHVVALSFGSVAVVQPLVVTELIFIPPIAAILSKIVVSKRDWIWIIVVSAALAGFLIVAQPTEGNSTAETSRWIICVSVILVVFALCMLIGRNLPPTQRAAVLGTGTGLINALYVVAIKGALGGPETVLLVILIILAILTALGGVGFATYAYRSGPVTVSSAAMIVVNPIVATLAAMYLFDVEINDSPLALVAIGIAVVFVIIGIIQLSRSSAVHGDEDTLDPGHPIVDPAGPLPE